MLATEIRNSSLLDYLREIERRELQASRLRIAPRVLGRRVEIQRRGRTSSNQEYVTVRDLPEVKRTKQANFRFRAQVEFKFFQSQSRKQNFLEEKKDG